MNPEIAAYIQKINQDWQVEVCQRLHDVIHQAVPEVTDRIQYGKPHYLKHGKYACVYGTAKGWVSFTIFNAESLEAPDGLFEASDTKDRQTIKIRQGQAVDYELLTRLIQQAASGI